MLRKDNDTLMVKKITELQSLCELFLQNVRRLHRHRDDFIPTAIATHQAEVDSSLVGIQNFLKNLNTVNDATEALASDLLPPLTVPDVVGMLEADAILLIENEGFVTPVSLNRSSSATVGQVIRQFPEAGDSISRSTSIQIFISTGLPQPTEA